MLKSVRKFSVADFLIAFAVADFLLFVLILLWIRQSGAAGIDSVWLSLYMAVTMPLIGWFSLSWVASLTTLLLFIFGWFIVSQVKDVWLRIAFGVLLWCAYFFPNLLAALERFSMMAAVPY